MGGGGVGGGGSELVTEFGRIDHHGLGWEGRSSRRGPRSFRYALRVRVNKISRKKIPHHGSNTTADGGAVLFPRQIGRANFNEYV